MTTKNCGSCTFNRSNTCVRFPPVPVANVSQNNPGMLPPKYSTQVVSVPPEVSAGGYCGEYQQAVKLPQYDDGSSESNDLTDWSGITNNYKTECQ